MIYSVQLFKYLFLIIITHLFAFSHGLAQLSPPKVKVAVQTKQGQTIKTTVKTTRNGNDNTISLELLNQNTTSQHLRTINVTITPTVPIPAGTAYMKGADEMEVREGQMVQMVTGGEQKYDHCNMYLMFKRGDEDCMC